MPGKHTLIDVRVTKPDAATVIASRYDGYLTVQGSMKADGSYEIDGLPDAEWSVQVSATRGSERFHGEASAPAGGTADVTVR